LFSLMFCAEKMQFVRIAQQDTIRIPLEAHFVSLVNQELIPIVLAAADAICAVLDIIV
jgi:hypothetical protein